MIKPKVHSKRIMFTLSLEDIRLITLLSEKMGETPSQIIKRAVITLCHVHSAENLKMISKTIKMIEIDWRK